MGPVVVATPMLLPGGTEEQALRLVEALVAGGRRVVVACYHERDPETVARFEAAGANVEALGMPRAAGLARLARALVRRFRALAPSAVHVQYVAPGLVPVLAARAAAVSTVLATVHRSGRHHGGRARLLLRTAARACTVFTCVTRAVERSWFGSDVLLEPDAPRLPGRHCTLYNAVDAAGIGATVRATDAGAVRRSLGLAGRRVVGIVGRLRAEKGQAIAVEAMPAILRGAPDAVLALVGDGPDRVRLEERARALGVAGAVRVIGAVPAGAVPELLAAMDVALVPSLAEGFGLAAAEALAAGVPLAAAAVDGLPEVVGEGGILVRPGDPAALAAAALELLAQPEQARARARRGGERVAALFSVDRFRAAVQTLYRLAEGAG